MVKLNTCVRERTEMHDARLDEDEYANEKFLANVLDYPVVSDLFSSGKCIIIFAVIYGELLALENKCVQRISRNVSLLLCFSWQTQKNMRFVVFIIFYRFLIYPFAWAVQRLLFPVQEAH